MQSIPELSRRGFVSSFEQEEYEVARFLNTSSGPYDDEDDEDEDEEEELLSGGDTHDFPEHEKEIFEDDDDPYIKDYF